MQITPGGSLLSVKKRLNKFISEWELHILLIPGIILVIVFCYLPMYGLIVAFKNYKQVLGYWGSPWVGLEHFISFINDPYFTRIFKNTILLGLYSLIFGFPAPILLALLLNEVNNRTLKRAFQTISFFPFFLSTIIVIGLIMELCSPSVGIINHLITKVGWESINFLDRSEWFRIIYVLSSIWQGMGYGCIIYMASIASINKELYEAAIIDGAGRLKQALHITIPCIMPTIIILFILSIGGILGNDYQKILLLYNPATYETADVIQTYIFRMGVEGASFSYSTAVGFFMSVISFVFLYLTNLLSKRIGETSLW